MTGHVIADLTSGYRAVRTDKFREFLHLLPNGFSYPTTSTMAFFRSAYPVAYVPIKVAQRVGKSHIKPLKDGVRFLLIIFKIATLYSPLKLFAPASAVFFLLGCINYAWTFLYRWTADEHEHADVERGGDRLSDRIGLRADHIVDLSA